MKEAEAEIQEEGNKSPGALRAGCGCFGTGYFPWEGC